MLRVLLLWCVFCISLLSFVACKGETDSEDLISKEDSRLQQLLIRDKVPEYRYEIINISSHDSHNFTEGLALENGYLYESTGLYKQSRLIQQEINSGKIVREISLSPQYFGEGITILGNYLYQLSYREQTGFVYDKNTFKLIKQFKYKNQGWGITADDHQLIMSNGSSTLVFIDPNTLKPVSSLSVKTPHHKISSLNELEYIHHKIFANVWPTSIIVIISPETGDVEGWINLRALKPSSDCPSMECVANGIAYNEDSNTLLITGKYWPHLYTIKLLPPVDTQDATPGY